MATIQQLGIQLATQAARKVVVATQADEDALNAMSNPSSTNKVAGINDVDGTGADITPNSVVTTAAITSGTSITSTTTVTATTGVVTNSITERTAGKGITMSKTMVMQNSLTALNATGTITAAMLNGGGITSTSAAPVTATLDAIATIATQIGAVNGTVLDFYVDNTAGANTVTVAVSAGITAATPVVTGGATLTVSVANAIGIFRLVFSSASAAKLYRIG